MDRLTISAASGMKARMDALEMLANNIANASTAGFKLDRENYNLYFSPEALSGSAAGAEDSTTPVLEKNWTDFSQGNLVQTGNSLDLALDGKGFFIVDGPKGPLYTRNGSFHISAAGRIETQEGYAVQVTTPNGQPPTLDPLSPIDIAKDGSISQKGIAVGKIGTADFSASTEVSKVGRTYFQVSAPVSALASSASVRQGSVESANVMPSESAVRLVSVMRQFEMLQRALSLGADMNRKAVEEVAKVS